MKANTKLGKIKETIIFGRLLRTSLAATAVFVMAFVFMPYILSEANATQQVNANIRWSAIDLTFDPDVAATSAAEAAAVAAAGVEKGSALTEEEEAAARAEARADALAEATHGNVEFGTIVPTAKLGANYGTMVIKKKTIGVTTRGKYYAVYLSMVGTETGLTYDGAQNTSMKISSTSGTWDTPKTVVADAKSGWGYMVPETAVKKSDGTTISAFGGLTRTAVNSSLSSYLDQSIYSSTGTAYTDSIWAGVPANTAPQQIWKGLTNDGSGFSTQDTFDVYYAINVDTDVIAGSYEGQVLYTAIASSESLDSVSTNLARTVKFGTSGTTQTIYFDLAQTTGGIIGEDNITVKLVPHADMVNANFNVANLTAEQKAAAVECVKVADSFTTVTTTQAATEGSLSTIQCTMPAAAVAQEYDYWLSIDGYNFNYVSKIEDGAEPGFAYAGLQTKKSDGTYYVTTMQDMSAGVCKNTYIWGNKWGSSAELFEPDGTATGRGDSIGLASASIKTGTDPETGDDIMESVLSVGSFVLTDTRDGKKYVVRRQADGNCWMSQNLDLELYNGMTLSSADSDISSSRGTWTLADNAGATTAWIPDAGSTSAAWQAAHGVTSATLSAYTYDPAGVVIENEGEEAETVYWVEDNTTTCGDGTEYAPCFIKATPAYYYVKNGAYAGLTDAIAKELPGATSSETALSAWQHGLTDVVAKVTFQVKKINDNVTLTDGNQTAWGSTNQGSACVMTLTHDGTLKPATYGGTNMTYCLTSTSGTATITQYDGMSGGYIDLPQTVSFAGVGDEHIGALSENLRDSSVTSVGTSAGDFRWQQRAYDGAHVYDQGPSIYTYNFGSGLTETTIVYKNPAAAIAAGSLSGDGKTFTGTAETSPTAITASNGSCVHRGLTQGTLKNANGIAYKFITCKDGEGNNLADTKMEGNKYNWYAAVAGSTHPSNGVAATDSICPKGWKLPVNSGNGSFYKLITGSIGSAAWKGGSTNTLFESGNAFGMDNTIYTTNKDVGVQAAPLSFLRSGLYYYNSGALGSRSSSGYYWSATSYSADASYLLAFYSSLLYPQANYDKGGGFAVRCVASAE